MSSSHKDNWRELAEMLGLSIDEPAPAPPAAQQPAPPPPPPEPMPAPRTDDYSADFSEQAAHSVLQPEDRAQFAAEYDDVVVEESEVESVVDEASAEVEPPSAETPEGEQSRDERRGRRRGRRGKRRGRDDAADAPAGDPALIGKRPESADDDDRRGRRSRGARVEEARPVAVEKAAAIAEGDNDDDFSQDAWADWNVPNWQELIDGLYRPDR